MHQFVPKHLGAYVPEHLQPTAPGHVNLKSAIDAADLTQIWDMILNLDYTVSDVEDLPAEKRDEFLNVMSLLLQAIDR